MAEKYIERFQSFSRSLQGLEKVKGRDLTDDFVLSGTVQKFALTFDIAWKVMKDILIKYHGINDFATGSPRETLRTAASVKLISDDKWMSMLADRNDLSHDYDGALAARKINIIINDYIPLFEEFGKIAGEYMDKISST